MAETKFKNQAFQSRAFALATQSADTNLTKDTPVKINFNQETFDVGGNFNTTDKKFVAPASGYYQVYAGVHVYGGTSWSGLQTVFIYKNNSAILAQSFYGATTAGRTGQVSGLIHLDANDYLEVFVQAGETNWLAYAEPSYTRFCIQQITTD